MTAGPGGTETSVPTWWQSPLLAVQPSTLQTLFLGKVGGSVHHQWCEAVHGLLTFCRQHGQKMERERKAEAEGYWLA